MLQKLHPKPYSATEIKLQDYSFWYLLSENTLVVKVIRHLGYSLG